MEREKQIDAVDKAIETIQNYCTKYKTCSQRCKFWDGHRCILANELPPYWTVINGRRTE